MVDYVAVVRLILEHFLVEKLNRIFQILLKHEKEKCKNKALPLSVTAAEVTMSHL